ncbi:hypothetical protein [Lysinibacillus boronitolerans]|uniref:hypothetical protein n=1 Tax=Lysinibacillus boronitolerans TaxID=309788 RepID=UPI0038620B28
MSDVSVRLDIVSVKISILSTDLKEQSDLSVCIHQNERYIRQIRYFIRQNKHSIHRFERAIQSKHFYPSK